ncbi:MAG TPA: two-component regulator propeller domain-containing protein, partial [Phnomibacter sp.]|nr:two-component regulator propeller domain-containing protein [Phnomibacter sp.]
MLQGLGQTFNFLPYTTRDGLAGNLVYDMCQDEEGFLWFGTDNGLSRFDGQQFKNFTVRDGLADNEVVRLHLDKKGRLWLGTFSNGLCYYYKGRFHNRNNDSVLAKNVPNSRPLEFYETSDGSLWILCQHQLFCWPANGKLYEVKFDPPLVNRVKSTIGFGPWWFTRGIPLGFNDSLFLLTRNKLVFYKRSSFQSGMQYILAPPRGPGDTPVINLGRDLIHVTWRNDHPHLVGTVDGAFEIDSVTLEPMVHFLPEKRVTRAMVDREGIYWFATLGDGVYKLPSKTARTFSFFPGVNAGNEVFSIGGRNDSILTGHGSSTLMIWQKGAPPDSINFSKLLPLVENSIATNRLKFIHPQKNGDWLLGFDGFMISWNDEVKQFYPMNAAKTFETEGDSIALVSTGQQVLRFRLDSLRIMDTVWKFRATSALPKDGSSYIGTLQGLFEVDKKGNVTDWGTRHPALHRRIAALQWFDRSLWVATSDSGLVEVIPGEGVGRTITEQDGLSSNICRTLYISRGQMWVGTNNGICKVDLRNPDRPFVKYNSFNLLPNDVVNAIMTRGI